MRQGALSESMFRSEVNDSGGFAGILRNLRRCHFVKQVALASAVGCTEAAVSYWENGKRAPDRRKFPTIASALLAAGATPSELDRLRVEWERARVSRAGC
jgi:transcriptional regulator with XRE-family HTH domain